MTEVKERKRKITLHLYDTDLSVNIPVTEEEYYRNGEKLITGIISSYMSRFKGTLPDKEIQYMALIDIALRYVKETHRKDLSPYKDILSELTKEIEEALETT